MSGPSLAPRLSTRWREEGEDDVTAVSSIRAPSVAPPTSAVSSVGRWTLAFLLVSTIVLQRFGVAAAGTSIPVLLPLGLALATFMLLSGDLRPTSPRLVTFLVVAVLLSGAGYLAARYSREISLTSLAVVLSIWGVFGLRARGSAADSRREWRRTARLFASVMTVFAVVGVGQLISQFVGIWVYRDYLGELVPPALLLPEGTYNTSIPLTWDSQIYKAQAFVFVEPSTFSQFTALAIILAILIRLPLWQVGVLGLGLVSALSGTGLMLLAVGLALLLLRAPRLLKWPYIVAGGVALVFALLTPASDVLFSRASETNSQTSSFALRFTRPYDEVAAGMSDDTRRWVSGAGPGASDRLLESGRTSAGLPVLYNIPNKLLFEYGLLATAAFATYLLVVLFRGPPTVVLPGVTLFWLLFLGGHLAVPHIVWAAWLLLPVWAVRE